LLIFPIARNIFFHIDNTYGPSNVVVPRFRKSVLLKDPKFEGNFSVAELGWLGMEMDSITGQTEEDEVRLD
jgi:hypothetical protein